MRMAPERQQQYQHRCQVSLLSAPWAATRPAIIRHLSPVPGDLTAQGQSDHSPQPMLLQRIQQQFIDSADLKYQCAETLAPQVEAATQAILACVTGGAKVLCGGSGAAAAVAAGFAAAFVGRYDRERPELAALCLSGDANLLSALGHGYEPRALFARQLRALGQAGDVLLLLTPAGATPQFLAAVQAAHERDMAVVALCGARGGQLAKLLRDTDILMTVAHEEPARVLEVQQLVLHCICDGVDAQLLGLPDQPNPEQEHLP